MSPMPLRRFSCSVVLILASFGVVFLPLTSRASLDFYEPWSYGNLWVAPGTQPEMVITNFGFASPAPQPPANQYSSGAGSVPTIFMTNLNLTVPGLQSDTSSTGAIFSVGPATSTSLSFRRLFYRTDGTLQTYGPNPGSVVYFSTAFQLTKTSVNGVYANGGDTSILNLMGNTANACSINVARTNGGNSFRVGIAKNASTGGINSTAYSTNVFSTNDIVFIVCKYLFVANDSSSTSNDVVQLWVNPPSTTFGAGSDPAGAITANNLNLADITVAIDRLNFRMFTGAGGNNDPDGPIIFDELRVGTTWADVTPAAPVAPKLTVTLTDAATVTLSWPTNGTDGFILQSTPQLLSTGTPWNSAGGSPTVVGDQYIQANTVAGQRFYRLSK